KGIASLSDLTKSGTIVVLCDTSQPCGKLAAQILAQDKITLTPASLEDKVTGVVTKITTGAADAGIVFVTDVLGAGDSATGVTIPTDQNVVTEYPASVTKEATNPTGGAAFIAYVAGPAGQAILA
ncbi:MAG TPA: extracellular solute-binding protein, partial [Ilumatobacteraceae bacterium]